MSETLANPASSPLEHFRPDLPEFLRDPYPYYRAIREHASPFQDDFGSVYVWHYHLVAQLLKLRTLGMRLVNGQMNAQEDSVPPDVRKVMDDWILMMNPPDHTRIRGLMVKTFQPRNIEQMGGQIHEVAEQLIAKMQKRSDPDLVRDFTYPYPVYVICSILGIPRDDWDLFTARSELAGRSIDPTPLNKEEQEEVLKSSKDSIEYFTNLIRNKRKHPSDDLTTKLVRDMDEDGTITEAELAANLQLLFGAGHETTSNMLGNGFVALAEHKNQWDALVENSEELAPSMVNEALRFDSSVQITARTALEDCEVEGLSVKRGTTLLMLLGSANRDASVFEEPEVFDILKERKHPPLSFGGGIHFCLGAHLTRFEGQIAIPKLVQALRREDIPSADDLERLKTYTLRGWKSIPLRVN